MCGWSSRGDARQRGARLALAAGADQHDSCRAARSRPRPRQEVRHVGEIAVLARRLVHAPAASARPAPTSRSLRRARHARSSPAAPRSRRSRRPRRAVVAADQLGQRCRAPRLRSPTSPSRSALVESQTIASTPSSPSARSASSSVGVADQRLGIELPVAGMQHRAGRRADHQRVRLGDRMGQRDQLEVERPDREARPTSARSLIVHLAWRARASSACARSSEAVNGVAQTGHCSCGHR